MKKLLTLTLTVILCCLVAGQSQAQTETAVLSSTSEHSWSAPSTGTWRVTKIEVWGGGGGGGNATNARTVGSGGGSGAYAAYTTPFIITEPLYYQVGAGGDGGARGETTYVKLNANSTSYLARATGGYGGTNTQISGTGSTSTSTASANTSRAQALDGTTKTQGNTGSDGSIKRTRSGSWLSGYSYSFSGTSGAGGKNVNNANGGASFSLSNNNASAGTTATNVGAGGSGALNTKNSNVSTAVGGSGANGQVKITYERLMTITLNYNDGTTASTSFYVTLNQAYGDNLPDLSSTRDNYIFVGWFTEAGTQVTANTAHTTSDDITLYAHWASTGEISGSTEVAPCANYTIFNTTAAEAIAGQTIVYSWGYSLNGADEVSLDVDKLEPTKADLSLELDHMGAYVFTRYVNVLGQKVASLGHYTINVSSVAPGAITTGSKYICTASDFTIGSETDATTTATIPIVYQWRYSKDGGPETAVVNSDKNELTQDDVTLSENGTYIFKRYATIGCAEAVSATGSHTLNVVTLPTNYATPTANYTAFCEGGSVEVTGADYTLSSVPAPNNIVTKFNWMISKDGAAAEPADNNATYTQELTDVGTYSIYAAVEYFNDAACVVNTTPVTVTVVEDPTIAAPSLSVTSSICPNGEITLTAASIVGGVGDGYTYNWQFHGPDAQSDWVDVDATQATYSSTTGQTITASNFLVTGNVQYRTYINNPQGCDYHSDPAALQVIALPIPIVSTAVDVCPAPGDTSFTTMVSTTSNNYQLRWFADATSTTQIDAPTTISLGSENVITYYVAQFDGECLSARVPVTLTITYTAHLGHDNGDLDQIVCQNSAMDAITFSHSGDCAPQVTFKKDGQSVDQIAGVTVTSGNGTTVIEGNPTEVATYSFHVVLQPTANTVCAAPNSFDGSIVVNPVYAVTDNQTICGGNYIISDTKGHSYSYNTSGTYTQTLESVTGCDSVVTLNLYVHEWNQFGFKENEELIAGWTSFSNVSSPINADVAGSASGSQITYNGWNGSNRSDDNLSSSSSLISESGSSLGLINGTFTATSLFGGDLNMNNGKNILVKTNTSGFGNVKLRFDYGVDRTKLAGQWSGDDHGFTTVQISYSVDGTNYTDLPILSIDLLEQERTYGSYEVNLSTQSSYAIENANNVYLKFVFSGARKSTFGAASAYTNYFLIDNICISGTQLNELELDGETEACTNQSLTLVATPPYTNTNVNPPVTTPVVYKWERIVNGTSTVLDETSNILVDNEVQKGDYQYRVSVGDAPCGQSATLNVLGIEPAYRLDIERHGHVCSNKVDKVSNITFTDCDYVNGMFIVTPSAEDMRTPGTYECQLSIPTTENQCDSIIKLILDVRKAFDTTIVANICLGETYNLYGFDITPIEEGITYYTSDPTWTCSTGCDSIYRLTLITSSVRQTLVSESNVTLAAWPMDNGITNYTPACGVRTMGSSFMVEGASNVPPFTNALGHTPDNDYCYTEASSNGALTWPNLASSCSGFGGNATYTDYSGAYFEIKLNPYDYENLKLKFDYKRENASTSSAQAFNLVSYSYKFSETGNYTNIGTVNLNSTDWASQTLNFSSANTLDHDVVYLKVEFIGGNAGGTQSCGTFSGSKYLPSYITVDNVMVWGDRPARATLNGPAQTCDQTYVCEGDDVTFNCQGDDTYFKFYVVDEIANDTTAFNGNPTLNITPTQSSTYKIVAVEQTTMCDSVWGPFNVELVKNPTITLNSGSWDAGICGDATFNNEIVIENATGYTFTWLTSGNVKPDGVEFNDDNNGTITIGGTLTNGGSASYYIVANPDSRCSSVEVSQTGILAARVKPVIEQTLGTDTVCQGDTMQFVISNMDDLNFALVPASERFEWTTSTATLANTDTLAYRADEATHSTRHYLTVKQNGCTTVDSVDIVVYNLVGDTLRLHGGHYVMNYGDIYLDADSLKLPDLMHNNEVVPENMIASITQSGGAKIYPNNMTDMSTTITWTITDQCGKEHIRVQALTFELPPCGDADHFTVTDVDGNTYSTVRVGLNCWMRENLKALNYADRTPVAKAMGYVNNDFPNADNTAAIFGRLYSWYSAMNLPEGSTATPTVNEFGHVQGVCPKGWFMPTPEYFMALHDIDMDHMRTNTYWLDGGGDNSTDFSILPGGAYNSDKDRFENILGNAYFWTADLSGSGQPKTFMADCHCYMWQILDSSPNHGFSVRCVKEKEKAE